MGRLSWAIRKKLPILLILLALFAGAAWWQRSAVLTWVYLRGLADADDNDRTAWVERTVTLGGDAVPGLLELLTQNNVRICANSEAGLAALAKQWGPTSSETAHVADELTARFECWSIPGREAVLEWYLATLYSAEGQPGKTSGLAVAACKLLPVAAKGAEKGVRVRTLALAEILLGRGAAVNVDLCRELATQGIASNDAEIRSRAIRLVMHAPLHSEQALLAKVVPFLKDAAPEVRRSAVLTVGLAEETVGIQEMLALLHDSDAEVRRLCEGALRGRGLQDDHVKLAFQISDPLPRERVKVVNLLPQMEDLDPESWLMHLSQDASPAVRAAAIRFAADDPAAVDFRARLLQMSSDDPSPTVRQLAAFYLKTYQR